MPKLKDFSTQKVNANRHTQRGRGLLEKSIREDGYSGEAMVAAADGELFIGSNRLDVSAEVFSPDAEPIIIHSDGTKPVIVVRDDIPTANDPRARRLGLGSNRIASLSLDWDVSVLQTFDLPDLDAVGFDERALADLGIGERNQDEYSRKIEAPIYTPKGEKPVISDLYDETKTKLLLEAIEAAEIPEDEKEFLRVAARRHTVINYKRVADFYAHSDETTQALMEDSALVIIDFNRAIELGYVKLSEEIAAQYKEDYPDA